MSRIPPPSRSSRSPLKPTPPTPSRARAQTPTTPSHRTRTTVRATTPTRPPRNEETPSKPAMSIKEAIALRRAEARKAQSAPANSDPSLLDDDAPSPSSQRQVTEDDADLLGRLPLRETIEKARSTGALNLATRSLPCLPSGLFEIHLNVTPDPLKSVENEPKLPPAEEQQALRRGGRREQPAWFEAQDLTVLKAWNNDIIEIQHEISLFGSLKTIDLHKNKLTALPSTFADLSFLTVLDLSQNQLTSLPDNLWSLPELTTLNISDNQLTSLPFKAPFQSSSKRTGPNSYASTDFFTPAVVRATTPLPKLSSLNASQNKILSSAIDLDLPLSLVRFDLSANPLGPIDALLQKLASLSRLRELRFERAGVASVSVTANLFASPPFPALRILDLSETTVTLDAVQAAFKSMKQELNHDFTHDEPPEGVTRILVGKRVVREAWELQLEKTAKARKAAALDDDWPTDPTPAKRELKSLVSEAPATTTSSRSPPRHRQGQQSIVSRKEVVKEAWEVEAEQGLLTEGGKRRARAVAAAQAEEGSNGNSPESPPEGATSSINNPQYYTSATQTLKLPASSPAPKAPHNRSFSLASPFASSTSTNVPRTADLALPAPTLPLTIIVVQPFADTLRSLILTNRRLDRTFTIPTLQQIPLSGFLPKLEELDLEGCNLEDTVTVQRDSAGDDGNSGSVTPPRANEPLLLILAKLFPSLRTLNLSYNRLTDASLTSDVLSALILQAPHRTGLRHLRLRGNRLSELTGLQGIAEMFKGNRDVPEWKMEEVDVRDNEIGKLPAELGLLPLDVFLVEGNTFRVPQRRVWEREGTKGLLSWLRGRIE